MKIERTDSGFNTFKNLKIRDHLKGNIRQTSRRLVQTPSESSLNSPIYKRHSKFQGSVHDPFFNPNVRAPMDLINRPSIPRKSNYSHKYDGIISSPFRSVIENKADKESGVFPDFCGKDNEEVYSSVSLETQIAMENNALRTFSAQRNCKLKSLMSMTKIDERRKGIMQDQLKTQYKQAMEEKNTRELTQIVDGMQIDIEKKNAEHQKLLETITVLANLKIELELNHEFVNQCKQNQISQLLEDLDPAFKNVNTKFKKKHLSNTFNFKEDAQVINILTEKMIASQLNPQLKFDEFPNPFSRTISTLASPMFEKSNDVESLTTCPRRLSTGKEDEEEEKKSASETVKKLKAATQLFRSILRYLGNGLNLPFSILDSLENVWKISVCLVNQVIEEVEVKCLKDSHLYNLKKRKMKNEYEKRFKDLFANMEKMKAEFDEKETRLNRSIQRLIEDKKKVELQVERYQQDISDLLDPKNLLGLSGFIDQEPSQGNNAKAKDQLTPLYFFSNLLNDQAQIQLKDPRTDEIRNQAKKATMRTMSQKLNKKILEKEQLAKKEEEEEEERRKKARQMDIKKILMDVLTKYVREVVCPINVTKHSLVLGPGQKGQSLSAKSLFSCPRALPKIQQAVQTNEAELDDLFTKEMEVSRKKTSNKRIKAPNKTKSKTVLMNPLNKVIVKYKDSPSTSLRKIEKNTVFTILENVIEDKYELNAKDQKNAEDSLSDYLYERFLVKSGIKTLANQNVLAFYDCLRKSMEKTERYAVMLLKLLGLHYNSYDEFQNGILIKGIYIFNSVQDEWKKECESQGQVVRENLLKSMDTGGMVPLMRLIQAILSNTRPVPTKKSTRMLDLESIEEMEKINKKRPPSPKRQLFRGNSGRLKTKKKSDTSLSSFCLSPVSKEKEMEKKTNSIAPLERWEETLVKNIYTDEFYTLDSPEKLSKFYLHFSIYKLNFMLKSTGKTFEKTFETIDINGDGFCILKEELREGLVDQFNTLLSMKEINKLVEYMDEDGNDLIDKEEFSKLGNVIQDLDDEKYLISKYRFLEVVLEQLALYKENERSKIMKLFKDFDLNHDGVLTLNEFEVLLKSIQPEIKMITCAKMFKETLELTESENPDEMSPEAFYKMALKNRIGGIGADFFANFSMNEKIRSPYRKITYRSITIPDL